jgi:hypothetical protein
VDTAILLRHAVLVGNMIIVQDCIIKGADLELKANMESIVNNGGVTRTLGNRVVEDTNAMDKVNEKKLFILTYHV